MGDIGPAFEASKCLLGFCCNRADYFDDLQDDLESLELKLLRLKNLQATIKKRVDKESGPSLLPKCRVIDWLVTAAVLEKRVVEVIGEAQHEIRHQCLRMFIPRCCCSYHRIGKRVSRMLKDVDHVLADSRFDDVVERQTEESWITNLTAQLQKTYQVSEGGDVAEAQEAIMRQLGLWPEDKLWMNKNEYERSSPEREEMKMEKFALLLCGLRKPREESDLFKVGVPTDYNTQGSKLVFTTPSKKVFNRMTAEKSIRISSLPKEASENRYSRVRRHLFFWHK
ncbi:hypothetical protein K2173_009419 [Erythroxylum novogranatense]|uniref:Rx N-terminal domain-containing protein n=1 Tax=Erythroxylum novogranatense TaxID=1862640 RepID=A0AAV8U818_9ROSI|nr:hypothetical protein K2173_009419 [Erythroxylum novogranatense]